MLDIYIELFENVLVVCFCVDGMLCDVVCLKKVLYGVLILWIKIMV